LNLANGSKPGSTSGGAVNIVVLQVDSRRFGLVVDEVNDAEEIVVKPLSKHLKGIKAYAGATIMGDGKLALILDVLGLAGAAGVTSESRERTVSKEVREAQDRSAQKQEFVLFTGPGDSRMALPLGSLARLEEFSRSQVERSGNQWTVQYRGKILPLVWVSQALDGERDPFGTSNGKSSDLIEVLVLNDGGRSFGLVVDKILDIVEATTDVKSPATRAGVLYSAVIAEHVTELLDVPAIRVAGEGHQSTLCAPIGVSE
jgi:two-component system chemotaxis sensor kinase CheA